MDLSADTDKDIWSGASLVAKMKSEQERLDMYKKLLELQAESGSGTVTFTDGAGFVGIAGSGVSEPKKKMPYTEFKKGSKFKNKGKEKSLFDNISFL